MEEVLGNPIRREIKLVGFAPLKLGWKARLFIYLFKIISMIALIITISFLIHDGSLVVADYALKKADSFYVSTLEKLPKSIIPPQTSLASRLPYTLQEAIERAAREQKVPVMALAAMVEQESSNGMFLTSQLEERTYARLVKSHAHLPDDELRQLARSHGPAHVMGITALEICKMNYADLYDNYKGLTCAAKYLRMQIDKSKAPNIEERLWQAFKGYNGTGAAAEKHADRVYALMKKKMTGSLSKELS